MSRRLLALGLFLGHFSTAWAVDWIRPGITTNQPVWGIRGGLMWALPPANFRSGGPGGLIRLGYPVLSNGGYDLINFVAIEPIVRGHRGFSELEHSRRLNAPGKRLWAEAMQDRTQETTNLFPGVIRTLSEGVEELEVPVRVERFDNGAHVRLIVSQRSDQPDELQLSIYQEKDSAPMEYCILTATMGNKARARLLWLADRAVSSLELYSTYKGKDFAPHEIYPLKELHRTPAGDVLVAATNDESDPSSVEPFPGSRNWRYLGFKVTQFWRKPAGFHDDLHVAVNARYMYWRSEQPIPGGISFENFELRERFYDGQKFVFGITRRTPGELGFKSK